jgi:general secretion pathway protein D
MSTLKYLYSAVCIVGFTLFASGCADMAVTNNQDYDNALSVVPQPAKQIQPTTGSLDSAKDASSRSASDSNPEGTKSTSHVFSGSGQFLKQPSAKQPVGGPADISLNFESADVRDIAKTVLAEILKENYIVDPRVQGTISLRTARPLPRDALMPTLETVLRMNGIVMIKENGVFKLMPAAGAKGSLSPQMGGAGAGFTMQVVPLSFIGAREMAKILENVAVDPALVKADELRNVLILAGTQNEMRHMLDTIEMFDVDWMSGMSVGLFMLKSAEVKVVNQDIEKVFNDKGSGVNPLAGIVRFIPIERLNAFVIITPQPKYLEQAKLWLERFDRVGGTGGSRLYVYHVQNNKAEHLAELLNQMFSDQKGQTSGRTSTAKPATVAPGLTGTQIGSTATGRTSTLGAASAAMQTGMQAQLAGVSGTTLSLTDEAGGSAEQVRVVADPQNNALLILANASGYDKIETALKKLDVAPRQVLIEVMIAEVTLKDELSYGIEWLLTNGSRKSGKLDMGAAGLNSVVPGFSYALTSSTGSDIKAVLNMLATDSKLNVLSSPHILVTDNQTAKIQVGDSVPTSGQQTVSGAGVVVSSVQYIDTGVILSVTPRINAGGMVNLDITQEVSTATSTKTSELNSPTIVKRAAKTALSVQSGETIVMGGLISEQSTDGTAGLPGLSSIPIIGGLFGTQSKNRSRTELVLLITPRVANNFNQAKTLSDELRKKMGDVKILMDCGTSNVFGHTTRGGLWCLNKENAEGNNAIEPAPEIQTAR